jgi:hypothetical protein
VLTTVECFLLGYLLEVGSNGVLKFVACWEIFITYSTDTVYVWGADKSLAFSYLQHNQKTFSWMG